MKVFNYAGHSLAYCHQRYRSDSNMHGNAKCNYKCCFQVDSVIFLTPAMSQSLNGSHPA